MRLLCPIFLVFLFIFSCASNESEKLYDGIYQSTKDSLAYIQVEKDKITLGYRGINATPQDEYSYKILDSAEVNQRYRKGDFLMLIGKTDTILYSGLRHDENTISMFFVGRGNFMEYLKVLER